MQIDERHIRGGKEMNEKDEFLEKSGDNLTEKEYDIVKEALL